MRNFVHCNRWIQIDGNGFLCVCVFQNWAIHFLPVQIYYRLIISTCNDFSLQSIIFHCFKRIFSFQLLNACALVNFDGNPILRVYTHKSVRWAIFVHSVFFIQFETCTHIIVWNIMDLEDEWIQVKDQWNDTFWSIS